MNTTDARSHVKISAAMYSGTGYWMARKMRLDGPPRIASKPLYCHHRCSGVTYPSVGATV